jgi:hypothetical protein
MSGAGACAVQAASVVRWPRSITTFCPNRHPPPGPPFLEGIRQKGAERMTGQRPSRRQSSPYPTSPRTPPTSVTGAGIATSRHRSKTGPESRPSDCKGADVRRGGNRTRERERGEDHSPVGATTPGNQFPRYEDVPATVHIPAPRNGGRKGTAMQHEQPRAFCWISPSGFHWRLTPRIVPVAQTYPHRRT